MEKNSTLDTNLKRYTALAGGLVATVGAVNAQVVYTDVNPDQLLSSTTTPNQLGIDFDGDQTVDVAFVGSAGSQSGTFYGYQYQFSYDGVFVGFASGAASTNGWMAASSSANGPAALNAGQQIGSTGSFMGGFGSIAGSNVTSWPNSTSYNNAGNFGEFAASQDGYIGVRFDISGSVYYGWVRIEIGADGKSMIIKDYAYESTAGTAITAGDTGNGFSGVEDIDAKVEIRNVYNKVNIQLDGYNEAEVTVVGLDGKQHTKKQIGSTAVLDLSELSTGIYLVNVATTEGMTTKKIYIK